MATKLRTPWQIQRSVWVALYHRELKTRFGSYKLGYFWALFEPVSHIIVLTFIFSFVARDGYQGVPFGPFFAAGIVPFFIFQKIVTNSIAAIPSNKGLFIYRQVKPIDPIVVRGYIELVTSFATLLFLMFVGVWFFDYDVGLKKPLELLSILILFYIGSLGFGFMVSVVGARWEETSKFIPQVLRPLYFISGIIIPIASLPQNLHAYLLWNPLLHGIEQFRATVFSNYDPGNTSLQYFLFWAIFSFVIGLWYFRINREKVLMT